MLLCFQTRWGHLTCLILLKSYDINTLKNIRIINISTDEVYGSLSDDDIPFSTETQFNQALRIQHQNRLQTLLQMHL